MKPLSCFAFVTLISYVACSQQSDLKLDYLKIHSVIQSRFATTLIQTKARNKKSIAEEVHFLALLPAQAFITHFTMQIGNRIIVGDVKEKDLAKQVWFTQMLTIKLCIKIWTLNRPTTKA